MTPTHKTKVALLTAGLAVALFSGCATPKDLSKITPEPFGKTLDGTPVEIYTLRNAMGMTARIMTYGGIVQSLDVPDQKGNFGDVVLGYDTLDGYLTNSPYFGSLIGRYGNRIAKGHFTLDGKTYTLAVNNGSNSLHGGIKGFDKVVWQVVRAEYTAKGAQLELSYTSPDGEEGYPGTLTVTALYTVTPDNGLRLDYTATTDEDTIVNLTQHSYFNLAGHGDILGHVVWLDADQFTPVDSTLIPTGELRSVEKTPFDFRTPATIGSRVKASDDQIKFGGGIDHIQRLGAGNQQPIDQHLVVGHRLAKSREQLLSGVSVRRERGLKLARLIVAETELRLQMLDPSRRPIPVIPRGGAGRRHRA